MKRNIVILWGCIMLICISAAAQKGFNISGQIQGTPNNTKVYLIHNLDNKADTVGRSVTKNGVFEFNGTVNLPGEFHYIKIEGQKKYTTLFLDNSKIRIEGTFANWPHVTALGSSIHSDYLQMKTKVDSYKYKIEALQKQIENLNAKRDSTGITRLSAELKQDVIIFNDDLEQVIRTNLNSLFSPFLITRTKWTYDKKLNFYEKLGKEAKGSFWGIFLKNEIELEEKSQAIKVGEIIPDFISNSNEGKKISMYDLVAKGKVTLIDFWASWCIPCRKEIHYLKSAYDKYKDKGFNIVSISLDAKERDWKDAIKKDGMNWTHLSQLKGRHEYAAELFAVDGIPASILIDSKGRILTMDLPGSKILSSVHALRQESLEKEIKNALRIN